MKLVHRPGGAEDSYRWRAHIEEGGATVDYIVVDLADTQAVATGLAASDIEASVEDALQVYSRGRLRNDVPVLDQVAGWNGPVVLMATHFRGDRE